MSNEASKPAPSATCSVSEDCRWPNCRRDCVIKTDPAPSVEQDARGAFEASFKAWTGQSISFDKVTDDEGDERYADEWLQGAWIGWQARAASTSANVALPQAVDLPPRVIDRLYQAAGVSTYHPDGDQQEKLHAFARNVVAETLARLLSASFISGKPVVMTEETRELARQVLLQRDNDTRTEQQKLADGAAFICDTRLDFPTSK